MGFIFCALCEREIVIKNASEVENFLVGVNLICPGCDRGITISIIDRIIDDNSVPKTYRKIFEQYIKWMEEKE